MKSNMTKQKRKNKPRKKMSYVPNPRPINLAPPSYQMQENRTFRVRATLTGAATPVGAVFAMNQLAAFCGIIATGATTSAFLCDQFRLRRMCLWGPVTTAGTPVHVMLKYVDDPASLITSGPPKTVEDTSVSFDRPAYVCLEPPKDNSSVYSQWYDSSVVTTVVTVEAPLGATLDVWFNWILDDIGQVSAGPTIAGGTAGVIYHKDMNVTGGAIFQAVPPLNRI